MFKKGNYILTINSGSSKEGEMPMMPQMMMKMQNSLN
jgi:hypothetical protein